MPCRLIVYDTQARSKTHRVCDEANTERLVEDDYNASLTAEYEDMESGRFSVDWTQCRLIGFLRKREDGTVIASGGADGSQTAIP